MKTEATFTDVTFPAKAATKVEEWLGDSWGGCRFSTAEDALTVWSLKGISFTQEKKDLLTTNVTTKGWSVAFEEVED